MVTLCERKAELAVGAVEREVIRCVKATKSWVCVDHGRLGLVDKRVRQLQHARAVGLTGRAASRGMHLSATVSIGRKVKV